MPTTIEEIVALLAKGVGVRMGRVSKHHKKRTADEIVDELMRIQLSIDQLNHRVFEIADELRDAIRRERTEREERP